MKNLAPIQGMMVTTESIEAVAQWCRGRIIGDMILFLSGKMTLVAMLGDCIVAYNDGIFRGMTEDGFLKAVGRFS